MTDTDEITTPDRSGKPLPSVVEFRSSVMRVSRAAQAAAGNLFISAKTSVAIPAPRALVRDALIQASLDPAVRAIAFLAQARVDAAPVDLSAIVIVRDDGRFVLDVVPARRVRDLEHEGLALIALSQLDLTPITLTAADIKREPRFGNSRLVWSHRLCPVGTSMRMTILQVLSDNGPMALSRLLSAVRSDRDPSQAVMALACSDLIELDLVSRPLGPRTIARSRA
jgi:hypothetical protein